MLKTRIYIVQLLGILVLLCGYFLSDPPDNLSVMHFNPNPDQPSVITKAPKWHHQHAEPQTVASSHHNNPRKTDIPKHIAFDLMLPLKNTYSFVAAPLLVHATTLPENYDYLFFEEINPPPPRHC